VRSAGSRRTAAKRRAPRARQTCGCEASAENQRRRRLVSCPKTRCLRFEFPRRYPVDLVDGVRPGLRGCWLAVGMRASSRILLTPLTLPALAILLPRTATESSADAGVDEIKAAIATIAAAIVTLTRGYLPVLVVLP